MEGIGEYLRSVFELAKDHVPEWLTACATFLLVFSTYLLYRATRSLVRATDTLAQVAREDGRNRKVAITSEAWTRLRRTLELPPDLAGRSPDEVEKAGKAALPSLRALEAYAACVNSEVYDLETFRRMSGNWYLQRVRWMRPYLDKKQSEKPGAPPYGEIDALEESLAPPQTEKSREA